MELDILLFFQSIRSTGLTWLFETMSMLGEQNSYIIFVSFLLWCFNKQAGLRIAFIMLFSGVINTGIKDLVQRPRPIGSLGLTSLREQTAGGFSFPSNHTQTSTAVATSASLEFRHKRVYLIAALFAFLVGLSRLYLGVHWPTDVLTGWVLGLIISLAVHKFICFAEEAKKNYLLILLIIPYFAIYFIALDDGFPKFAGTFIGLLIGYLLDSYHFNFSIPASIFRKAARFVVGIIGAIVILSCFKFLIPGYKACGHLVSTKYFLLGLWLSFGAQMFFNDSSEVEITPENVENEAFAS